MVLQYGHAYWDGRHVHPTVCEEMDAWFYVGIRNVCWSFPGMDMLWNLICRLFKTKHRRVCTWADFILCCWFCGGRMRCNCRLDNSKSNDLQGRIGYSGNDAENNDMESNNGGWAGDNDRRLFPGAGDEAAGLCCTIWSDFYLAKRVGFVSSYALRSGSEFNLPAALTWILTLAFCLGINMYGGIEIFFLGLPGWFVAVILYVVLSKLMQQKTLK